MSDISELEQRIAAAFDRMDRGLEGLARARAAAPAHTDPALSGDAAPQMAALLRALEHAKASGAEWSERYRALEAQMSAETLAMATEIARLTALIDAAGQMPPARPQAQPSPPDIDRDAEIDELTARIAQQEAELETLRALRAKEAGELGDLIAALSPLVAEAPHV